jgi:hypothetical protein
MKKIRSSVYRISCGIEEVKTISFFENARELELLGKTQRGTERMKQTMEILACAQRTLYDD